MVGDVITENTTIYIYAALNGCNDESLFTITIAPAVADEPVNVTECGCYELPALSTGNAYYTATGGPSGTGTEVAAGTLICNVGTNTLYVFAQNGACTDEHMFTITIGDIVADVLAPVTVCDSYILQPLSANNNYYTMAGGPAGGGTVVPAGTVVSASGINTFYIWAQLGNCNDQSIFTVTVNPTPIVPQMGDVNACDEYILPTLAVGSYFTGPNGTGTQVPAQTVITTDTTLYIYAESGTAPNTCSSEDVFSIFITDSPVVGDVADVSSCEIYVLPAIVGEGDYYTGAGGTGTMMIAGDEITSSQTIYVFAQSQSTDGTLMCTAEDTFMVTITGAPEFNITGECQNNAFVLTANVENGSFDPAGVTYEWSTTEGEIIGSDSGQSITIEGAGTYSLTITSGGCPTVTHPYQVSGTSCMIQKGISANNDGDNDCFMLEGFNVTHLSIFNRYGMKVFEQGTYVDEWCGQSDKGDELPSGTYYYVMERSNAATSTGWIYITREQ
jgi:gliding motility-associated-like protein